MPSSALGHFAFGHQHRWGVIFVNQTAEYDVADYVRNLFLLFGTEESNAAAAVYSSLGSPLNQVTEIMGNSIFKCPTYSILNAFPGEYHKGGYAIPPAWHGQDVNNYFPSFTAFNSSLIYNNTAFIDAFTQGFLSFAVNLDPNDKLRPSITPVWQKGSNAVEAEMLFNKTDGGAPHIASIHTSGALSERWDFWNSVCHLTAQ
ncbi:hypothetical protein B0H12DRAFT_1108604 [Mycena haematopus]|nr:hypothetical protein B0H12DRAFT_1108604 [Mycena haematopus]